MFLVPMGRNAADFSRSLERLFDDRFFDRAPAAGTAEGSTTRSPALDILETERGYTVLAELPGVAKEDIKVQIDGRRVSLSAELRPQTEARPGERLVHRERGNASYARSFTLPVEIDQADSKARLDQGVLTLELVKRGAPGAASLKVQ